MIVLELITHNHQSISVNTVSTREHSTTMTIKYLVGVLTTREVEKKKEAVARLNKIGPGKVEV